LTDDGKTGYGTLFGQVIGAPAGLCTTGTNLGPHTAAASGKITCWDKTGVYAVSLDAVDTAANGLVMANVSLTPGKALCYSTLGLLTPTGSTKSLGTAIGYFIEFETSPFLVTTPASLVGATEVAVRAVFNFISRI
jgi:hypothetical protein